MNYVKAVAITLTVHVAVVATIAVAYTNGTAQHEAKCKANEAAPECVADFY